MIPYSFSTVPQLHGGIAYHIHLQSSHFQHFLSLLSLELPIYIKDTFPCTPIQVPFFLISESSHTFHIQSISSKWSVNEKKSRILLTGPLMVPDANRSPARRLQPFIVWCASCWDTVQYLHRERESFSWLLCRSECLETPSSPKSEEGEHHITLLTSGHFRVQGFWSSANLEVTP